MELEESVLKLDAGFDKAKAVAENLFVHFPCLGSLKNQLFSVFKSLHSRDWYSPRFILHFD